jgi:hypothetical protein
MTLREKIELIIREAVSESEGCVLGSFVSTYADEILAIPEIAEALEASKAWQDAAFLGTGIMKDGKRIDPAEVYFKPPEPGPNEMYSHDVGNLGHRISTAEPD